jgi:hypothetical protein
MSVRNIFSALALLGFVSMSAAFVGQILGGAAEAREVKKEAKSEVKKEVKKETKEDKAPAASAAHQVKREAPIVMGRSVSVHHKTKLHHIKVKPIE